MKVVFVCTGNTCRSPMAEHLLKDRLGEEDDVTVTSAGVTASTGRPPAQPGVEVLKEVGVDSLAMHTSRPVGELELDEGDLVLTMTPAHKNRLPPSITESPARVDVLKEFVGRKGGISDPFGGDVDRYRELREELGPIVDEVYQKLKDDARTDS